MNRCLSFLSDDECKKLIVSACTARPHTEDEIKALIRWAECARLSSMTVDLVLAGKLRVEWTPEGEPRFNTLE